MKAGILILDVVLEDSEGTNWGDRIAIGQGVLPKSVDEQVAFQFVDFEDFMDAIENGRKLYDDVTIYEVYGWDII